MTAPRYQAVSGSPKPSVPDGAAPEKPDERLTVSLKSLATMLDAHRSSVRRWLREAGIHPVVLGRGRNGAIRYRWADVESWLASLPQVD